MIKNDTNNFFNDQETQDPSANGDGHQRPGGGFFASPVSLMVLFVLGYRQPRHPEPDPESRNRQGGGA